MYTETFFRSAFVILIVVILAIRFYGHRVANTFSQSKQDYDEGTLTRLLRPLMLLVLASVLVYLVNPRWMSWASLPLPTGLRLVSIPLAVPVVVGMAWVHRTLSANFSGELKIRDDHTLVTNGPYRYVRHPMYTVVIALFFVVLLMTANWFIGFVGLLCVSGIIFSRTPHEEAMLLETFGETYRTYMQRTPRYLPFTIKPRE